MKRALVVPLLILLVATFASSAATAQTSQQPQVLTFEDESGANLWSVLDTNPPASPGVGLAQAQESLNRFLRVSQTLQAGLFGSAARLGEGRHWWRPMFDGPISSFGLRLQARVDIPDPLPGLATPPVTVSIHLVVRQSGRRFRSLPALVWRSGFAPENTWIHFPQLNAAAEDFRDSAGTALRPNFNADAAEIRFGIEVSVSLPAPTGATYLMDLDGIAVSAFRSGNLPPGVAFDPTEAYFDGTSTLFQVVSDDDLGDLKFLLRRIGDSAVPLRAQGSWLVTAEDPEPRGGFSASFAPGASSFPVSPPGNTPSLCPYRVEATLEQVTPGQVYTPFKLTQFVLPTVDSDDCFVRVAAYLTQAVVCGTSPQPITRGAAPSPLDTLHAFRDQVMAASAPGRYYRELYQTHSAAAIQALFKRPQLVLEVGRAWEPWVEGAAAMVAGNGESVTVTNEMHTQLGEILDSLKLAGPPSLARAIEVEQLRLDFASWEGKSFAELWQRVLSSGLPEPCVADGEALCLNGGRYRVEADWKKPNGETGRAKAVALTGDSGYFWFFNAANVEILTKVLNGCGVNGRTWSFSAGLTNLEVELFVLDTQTGVGKRYTNPQRTDFAPILDTSAINCSGAASATTAAIEPRPEPSLSPRLGGCVPGAARLCLRDGRFAVEATWTRADGTSGPALMSPLTDDTGTFWFFRTDNVELVVKVLDACATPGRPRFWVFAGGTTNVGVELRVLDTRTGAEKRYQRPVGRAFAPILDTDAFATCSP